MDNAVKENQKAWKQWKNGVTKEEYLKAKKAAKQLYILQKEMQRQNSFPALTITDKNHLFKMTKRLKQDNVFFLHVQSTRFQTKSLQ